jgi:hypothetical protein
LWIIWLWVVVQVVDGAAVAAVVQVACWLEL